MKHNFLTIAILACLLVIFSTSCKKETSAIGLEMQDEASLLSSKLIDTITIDAITVVQDSVPTDGLPTNVLGVLHDPIFGSTVASVYTQYALDVNNVTFGSNPQVDSVILTIRLLSAYGDTLAPLSIQVRELAEAIEEEKTYYESTNFNTKGENLLADPSQVFLARPNAFIEVDGSSIDPHLRIPLSTGFGQYFIDNVSNLTDNETFKSFFNGLAIECKSTNSNVGVLLSCNFLTSVSGLTIYYHNDNGAAKAKFINGNTELRVNTYLQDYQQGSTALRHQIFAQDGATTDEQLFCQSGAGVRTELKFPYLISSFKDKKIIVNKAELVISNIDDNPTFSPSSALGLQAITQEGNLSVVPDDDVVTGNSDFFGGVYDDENEEYRFRITRYIQNLMVGDATLQPQLYLVSNSYANIPGRLVLGGTNPSNPAQRIRLEITYTQY